MVSNATQKSRKEYLTEVLNGVRKLGNREFEDLINELFEKNGYKQVDRNWFDKKGGDVDIVFKCFSENTLMYNIFDICSINMPHIYIQAKKKSGSDFGDKNGIDQLIKMKEYISEKNPILMVINLTDDFTEESKKVAFDEGIILIDGLTFASLLVRFGIHVELE